MEFKNNLHSMNWDIFHQGTATKYFVFMGYLGYILTRWFLFQSDTLIKNKKTFDQPNEIPK